MGHDPFPNNIEDTALALLWALAFCATNSRARA